MKWLPIVFFVYHAFESVQHGWASDILWVCNIANLALGIGMLTRNPQLIRGATLWLVAGLPFWIREVVIAPDTILPGSYLTHLVSPILGVTALTPTRPVWPRALAAFVVLQALSRLVAKPESNVNVAFAMRDGWDRVFSSYWQYWLFTTLVAGAALAVVDLGLGRVIRREAA